jgi:DNA-binding transcriptional regulator YdaS (Cro superfamily)
VLAEELRDSCVALYGTWGWQTKLASELGVDPSSVRRWVSGAVPIPGPVAAAVRCFLVRNKKLT